MHTLTIILARTVRMKKKLTNVRNGLKYKQNTYDITVV